MGTILLKDYTTNGILDRIAASKDITKMLGVGYLMANSILQYAIINKHTFIDKATAKQYSTWAVSRVGKYRR